MDSTQTITRSLSEMTHSNNWDRLLVHAFQRLHAGCVHLTLADGTSLSLGNESGEQANLVFHDRGMSKEIIFGGSMALSESYMQGKWSTTDLSALLRIFARSQKDMGRVAKGTSHVLKKMDNLMHKLRKNTKENARKNIQEHYDLSNELYESFLDPTLTYSAAIFGEEGADLEEAQYRKTDRLIEQLDLKPEDHVLEIGSGWGACAIRMAQKSGCRVTSLTLSDEQAKEARERVAAAGLEDRVEIRIQDYRDVEGSFDHVISIEMIEAVGHDFLASYFHVINDRLKMGGRFALQAITIPDERYQAYNQSVDFIRKHIFPGGHLPSPHLLDELRKEHTSLKQIDDFEFGKDYAETLRRWSKEFFKNIDQVKALGFDDVFIRKWHYYLAYCEAGFDTELIHVRQMCYQKD